MNSVWTAAFLLLWMLVLIEAFFIFAILRQIGILNGRAPQPKPALPVGTAAPDFVLPDRFGLSVSLRSLAGRNLLLAFVSPNCPARRPLLPALAAFQEQAPNAAVLVCAGSAEDCRGMVGADELAVPVLIDTDQTTLASFRVPGTPHVYRLDRKGVIRASGVAHDLAELQQLWHLDPQVSAHAADGDGRGMEERLAAGSATDA